MSRWCSNQLSYAPAKPWSVAAGTARATTRRQEVHWPGDDHHIDILGTEVELADAGQQLGFQLRRAQFARLDAVVDHVAPGRDVQLQHDLALQAGRFAQRALVIRLDRALVVVEDQLDVLDQPRRLAAAARVARTKRAGAKPQAASAGSFMRARSATLARVPGRSAGVV